MVISGLLDKLFATESKARKLWIEGEVLWKNQDLKDALVKYNEAVDLGKRCIFKRSMKMLLFGAGDLLFQGKVSHCRRQMSLFEPLQQL